MRRLNRETEVPYPLARGSTRPERRTRWIHNQKHRLASLVGSPHTPATYADIRQ